MAAHSSAYVPIYLEKLKISRGVRMPGEVFAMRFRGIGYIFGRVIRNACISGPPRIYPPEGPRTPTPGLYLVYIFKGVFRDLNTLPDLHPENLLLPPKMIYGGGWTRGYFVKVVEKSIAKSEVLPGHCFYYDGVTKDKTPITRYVDELGRLLSQKREPCSPLADGNYGSTERAIANALRLPYPEP